jgi:Rrf2 family iron-sulfur cluster assembly transcriptional regulator
MTSKITTKTQYAVAALIELGSKNSSCSIAHLATSQALDHDYLGLILLQLKKSQLVESVRGAKGGYKLAKPSEEIAISHIMAAVGDKIKITRCNEKKTCTGKKDPCLAHKLYSNLEKDMISLLDKTTLKDLLTGAEICI